MLNSFMQVPNSDFYNISVGGAHKGFSKSSSVPHYPSSSHQITDFFYEYTAAQSWSVVVALHPKDTRMFGTLVQRLSTQGQPNSNVVFSKFYF